jgi:hypothetical protein
VHSTLRGPSVARGRGERTPSGAAEPELTMMELEASVVLAQAAGVSQCALLGDRCAVVLRDGRWASRVQHSAAADVAAPSRGRC